MRSEHRMRQDAVVESLDGDAHEVLHPRRPSSHPSPSARAPRYPGHLEATTRWPGQSLQVALGLDGGARAGGGDRGRGHGGAGWPSQPGRPERPPGGGAGPGRGEGRGAPVPVSAPRRRGGHVRLRQGEGGEPEAARGAAGRERQVGRLPLPQERPLRQRRAWQRPLQRPRADPGERESARPATRGEERVVLLLLLLLSRPRALPNRRPETDRLPRGPQWPE